MRQPARLSCPFAPGADLDAISLSDAPDRTEVGPARGRSFPKNKLASVGHEREQLFQRWWASHVLHLARKSPCFAMRMRLSSSRSSLARKVEMRPCVGLGTPATSAQ